MAEQQVQSIQGTFEWQGRSWKSYTNGKIYGDTRYITISTTDGSYAKNGTQAKIVYSLSKGISIGGSHGIDLARVALRSLGFDE